jgi:hypothetical protein
MMDPHNCQVCGVYAFFGFLQADGDYLFYCREHQPKDYVKPFIERAPMPDFVLDRQAGLQRVMQSNSLDWEEKFREYIIVGVRSGTEALAEEWRLEVERIIGPPLDPHSVGSVINHLVKAGYLVETDRWRAPKDSPSNKSKKNVKCRTGKGWE